jgi:hypothetical protein
MTPDEIKIKLQPYWNTYLKLREECTKLNGEKRSIEERGEELWYKGNSLCLEARKSVALNGYQPSESILMDIKGQEMKTNGAALEFEGAILGVKAFKLELEGNKLFVNAVQELLGNTTISFGDDGTKINGVDIFFKRIPYSDDMPIVYTHSITTVNEERRLDIDL